MSLINFEALLDLDIVWFEFYVVNCFGFIFRLFFCLHEFRLDYQLIRLLPCQGVAEYSIMIEFML